MVVRCGDCKKLIWYKRNRIQICGACFDSRVAQIVNEFDNPNNWLYN